MVNTKFYLLRDNILSHTYYIKHYYHIINNYLNNPYIDHHSNQDKTNQNIIHTNFPQYNWHMNSNMQHRPPFNLVFQIESYLYIMYKNLNYLLYRLHNYYHNILNIFYYHLDLWYIPNNINNIFLYLYHNSNMILHHT